MPTLEVLDGPDKGKLYQIERDETVLGRLPYCDIVLAQKSVSRQHTRIVHSGGEYFVEDMHSTNGTFLNGKRIRARMPLSDQDLIRIYDVSMLFRLREAAAAEAGGADPASREYDVDHPEDDFDSSGSDDGAGQTTTTASVRRNFGVNAYEKLRTVLEINRTLGSALNVNLVLPKILDSLFTVFPQSDRAYVLFPDAATGQLKVRAEKHKDEGTMATSSLGPISHTIANRVLSRGEAILSADGLDNEDFDFSDSVIDFPIRSMMCAPLIGPLQKPLGIIYVDTNDPYERFHEDDLEVLLSVAAIAGQAVEYAQSHEVQLQMDRRTREMATARQVQLHFLPQSRPDVPGYAFFDYYRSAEEVGGDYYGYLEMPDGRVAITLGDVSGKGFSAALIMARLCSDVRYHLVTSPTPADAVQELNTEFCKPENEAWFVSMILCILDPRTHQVTLINAGHMPPLHRLSSTDHVQELGKEISGPPLGCDEDKVYLPFTVHLDPGDSLVMYTDGINEAMNPQRELYGVDRVRQTLKSGPASIRELCECLLKDVQTFSHHQTQSDDVCLIGLQRT
jgi:serine phosphatase RsbU (regulator of sigma subunit)